MTDDQIFQLVALVTVALYLAAGVLPLPPGGRRLARIGAIVVLVGGVVAAFGMFLVG
ncbi:MAG: hypothetical protein AAFX81_07150 [Pseudomonadota bacterium]